MTEVPDDLAQLASYMASLQTIKFMYEENGRPQPEHLVWELERCEDRLRQLLERHYAEGGGLRPVLAEMKADPANKQDYTDW